jgi:hypothetical protein
MCVYRAKLMGAIRLLAYRTHFERSKILLRNIFLWRISPNTKQQTNLPTNNLATNIIDGMDGEKIFFMHNSFCIGTNVAMDPFAVLNLISNYAPAVIHHRGFMAKLLLICI